MKTSLQTGKLKLRIAEKYKLLQASEKLSAFIITLVIVFTTQFSIGAIKFVGDANAYWHYSSFILNFDFPQTMRGYFYPLILAAPRYVFEILPSSGYLAFYILQATIFAYILSIILPHVFTSLLGGKVSIPRRLIPPMLVALFFPGLMAHPLSDLPALCMIVTTLYFLLKVSTQGNLARALFFALLAGITAYGAYSTRTIYLFTLLALIPLIPSLILRDKPTGQKLIFTLFFLVGVSIASIPQVIINLKHLNSPSPLVVTNHKNISLYANQLKWGITIQRYETGYTPENGAIYPIYYLDPVGERVFRDSNLDESPKSVIGFLGLIADNPVSFTQIYSKHFINGLDVRDPDPYTSTLSKDRNLRSFASIGTVMLGIFYLIYSFFKPQHEQLKAGGRVSRMVWI
ncbi:hypothetical protein QCD79_05955, partial [Pseudomonas quasicaspiana]|nr:hypothetical protein [Pseudomonas quasicaspiana]